jgi:uncharacterized protein YaaW (UPF0174 family)
VANLNIDVSEFEGDIEALSKILQKKLRRKINLQHSTLQINDKLSNSIVRDALKHALHKLEPKTYRIISKSGSLKIKKLKPRLHKIKRKSGVIPTAPQSLSYFFPR